MKHLVYYCSVRLSRRALSVKEALFLTLPRFYVRFFNVGLIQWNPGLEEL